MKRFLIYANKILRKNNKLLTYSETVTSGIGYMTIESTFIIG